MNFQEIFNEMRRSAITKPITIIMSERKTIVDERYFNLPAAGYANLGSQICPSQVLDDPSYLLWYTSHLMVYFEPQN